MQRTSFDRGLKRTTTDLSNNTNSICCHLSEATTSTEGTSPQLPPLSSTDNINKQSFCLG